MELERHANDPPPRLSSRVVWVPPACGFLASLLMGWICRMTGYQYRQEITMATYFVVSILVGGYYNNRLISRPAAVIAFAIFGGAVGASIMHW